MADTKTMKKKRRFKIKYKLVMLAILLFILFGTFYYKKSMEAVSLENPQLIEITIPEGTSSKGIARILKEEGLIRNELVFQLNVKRSKKAANLRAGVYSLDTGMDMNHIISTLTKGGRNNNVLTITIPEGYEIRQIADELSRKDIIDKEVFLNLASNKEHFHDEYTFLKELDADHGLEGYLFPSTYEIYHDSTEEDIIKKMLDKFEEVYVNHIEANLDNINLSLQELITLSSIVEREARVDKERPIIAGVLYNRLDIDMLLQVDATIQYALEERKERLLYKDLEIDSPYNTYRHKGLPPAPIASPGEKSIMATMDPADVDHLYYVLKKDGSGEHIFTKTYEDHLKVQSEK